MLLSECSKQSLEAQLKVNISTLCLVALLFVLYIIELDHFDLFTGCKSTLR
jgi:hypothetical protein